jgi:hypothetical protein
VVVAAFSERQVFEGSLGADELKPVFAGIAYSMMEEQLRGVPGVALFNVPMEALNLEIDDGIAQVGVLVHVSSPKKVFLQTIYTMENDPRIEGVIRVRPGTIKVACKTHGLGAGTLVKLMQPGGRIAAGLTDLNGLVMHTLNQQLMERHLELGQISRTWLKLNGDELGVRLCLDGFRCEK